MLLVLLLGWMILGFISIYGVAFIHIFKSYMKGYNSIEWWQNHSTDLFKDGPNDMIRMLYRLIVWPIRLMEFIDQIPYLYEQYELQERSF